MAYIYKDKPMLKREHGRVMSKLEDQIRKEFEKKGTSKTLLSILYNMKIEKIDYWLDKEETND